MLHHILSLLFTAAS
ncbi:BgTH12-07685 [Blumeria graminis f. sp. triticale]|uniref:BgTH12-07685 n=1 Tax=Blumeria graminis f. sp. triticale TaxID=1689686 RepID=A0A9W4CXS8_BLUGR|nr:BgTH12-07685 [Blumeria graminis f. sp. triticale]